MRIQNLLIIALALIVVVLAVIGFGAYRREAGTRELRARLEAARRPIQPQAVDFRELATLPDPVQRFFRTALRDGQPMIASISMRHRGTFNMGETKDQWKSFSSNQRVMTQRPGFDWEAGISLLPGLVVRVHDAYLSGEGVLQAKLFGLFTLVDTRGPGEMAEGELMRFFAEAAWYPTALLPSQGVRWEAVDDGSARATLTDGSVTVTLLFTFNQQSLIDAVAADARGRTVKDKIIPTPWRGRFWNYVERDGMRVPLDGEVGWLLPAGEKPYWRGHLMHVEYELVSR